MSYAHTDVLVYGVAVTYEEARDLLGDLGRAAFEAQRAVDFAGIKEDWQVASWDLELAHEMLAAGIDAEVSPCGTFTDLADFYDVLGVLPFLTRPGDVETITWTSSHGRVFRRTRYHVDLVCEGFDARADQSRRCLAGHTSYFGVVLGSHGYGYTDDLARLAAEDDPRIVRNFARYCEPALVARGWARAPTLREVGQVW